VAQQMIPQSVECISSAGALMMQGERGTSTHGGGGALQR